jgi:anti-anti-sigma factor
MRAHQHAAPLVVVRSEAEAGRVGLRLIGELDLNTVALLEAELARSREHAPPAVIDLSELRFLDLVGLRALLRLGQAEGVTDTRLVGATGIVRRLIELTRTLDAETDGAAGAQFAGEPTTIVAAESFAEQPRAIEEIAASAIGNSIGDGSTSTSNGNGNGSRPAAVSNDGDAQ